MDQLLVRNVSSADLNRPMIYINKHEQMKYKIHHWSKMDKYESKDPEASHDDSIYAVIPNSPRPSILMYYMTKFNAFHLNNYSSQRDQAHVASPYDIKHPLND